MWQETKSYGVDEFERMRRRLWIDVYLAGVNANRWHFAAGDANAALQAFDAAFTEKGKEVQS